MPGSLAMLARWSARTKVTDRVALGGVAALVVLRFAPGWLGAGLVAGALIALAVAAVRRPVDAAVWLTAMPFASAVLAFLYRVGFPATTVRALGLWKETLAAGMAVAAVQLWHRSDDRRLPLVELVAVGLLVCGLGYAVLGVETFRGPGPDLSTRLAAFRTDLGPIALLVIARHLHFTLAACRRLHGAVTRMALVLVAAAVVELTLSSLWNRFWVDGLRILEYRIDVLGVDPATVSQIAGDVRIRGEAGSRGFLRLGSFELDHIAFAFLCVLALAIAVEHLVRRPPDPVPALLHRGHLAVLGRLWDRVAPGVGRGAAPTAALAGAILLNQTRSAVVVAAAVLLLATRDRPGRVAVTRAALRRVLGVAAAFALVVAAAVGLLQRFVDDPRSNALHTDAISHAWRVVVDRPFGLGLGSADGAGQAGFGTAAIVPEDQYLQIGLQLGWVPMAAYAVVLVASAVELRRRAVRTDDGGISSAGYTALAAVLVVGLFSTPFARVSVGWLTALVAGVALGAVTARPRAEATS